MLQSFIGGTLGLSLRIFLKNYIRIQIGFFITNISIVNFLASLFLGIFVALNPINNNYSLLSLLLSLDSQSHFLGHENLQDFHHEPFHNHISLYILLYIVV